MPTAAKLVAALAVAVVAFLASERIKPLMPDGTPMGQFSLVNAALGAIVGWLVLGRRVGRGYRRALEAGVLSAALLVFWGLLGHSIREMLIRATQLRYTDTADAVRGVPELMLRYGGIILDPAVIAILALGGLLAGLLSEWAAGRWR